MSIESNLHNIGLMNSSNTGPLVISGIFESIICDALAGLLCDELNTLYNSINNLKIYTPKVDSGQLQIAFE